MATILIVDDAKFSRNRVVSALTAANFRCLEAVDGANGLERVAADRPDAIVTDLLMPNVDGLAFLRALRGAGNQTPVVVVSADIQSSSRAACAELGAVAFLNKPFKPEEVVAALRAALPETEMVPA